MATIKIEVKGLDKLVKGMSRFPRAITLNMARAGKEASKDVILDTPGLLPYPPETAANAPPTPYYIRGRGTQTARGNLNNSERLGSQYYTKHSGWDTIVGNPVSYAKWVIGKQQARALKRIGWLKLFDVAKKRKRDIQKVYQGWIDRTIRQLGL